MTVAAAEVPSKGQIETAHDRGRALWKEAELATALVLIDPDGLGGLQLRSHASDVRTLWLSELRKLIENTTNLVNLPISVSADRLIGGISLNATLSRGHVVTQKGLLAEANGQILLVRMAERLDLETASAISAALDHGYVQVERDGLSTEDAARFCAILLDEGDQDEHPPEILTERIALQAGLEGIPLGSAGPFRITASDITSARDRLAGVLVPEGLIGPIVHLCARYGLQGIRPALHCLRAAAAFTALAGRNEVEEADVTRTCGLVLGAITAAEPMPPQQSETADQPKDQEPDIEREDQGMPSDGTAFEDMMVEAVEAAQLLNMLSRPSGPNRRRGVGIAGKSGDLTPAKDKGRPAPAQPTGGQRPKRVDLVQTLRAAAPWQKVRRKTSRRDGIHIQSDDLREKRFKRRSQSSVIFVVDASGSAAMNRLAEAKGAVEHLLTDCYSRRDLVSLISFRGTEAELLLSPTRSLVRVRRCLGDLPGGGGTPLASAILLGDAMADRELAKGRSPLLVFLSDGRGNIALDGSAKRTEAASDGEQAARHLKSKEHPVIFFDTARRPGPPSRKLADDLGASYYFLPRVDGEQVSKLVRDRIGRR